jgi:hypothetical protein
MTAIVRAACGQVRMREVRHYLRFLAAFQTANAVTKMPMHTAQAQSEWQTCSFSSGETLLT